MGAVREETKDVLLSTWYSPVEQLPGREFLGYEIYGTADGSFGGGNHRLRWGHQCSEGGIEGMEKSTETSTGIIARSIRTPA